MKRITVYLTPEQKAYVCKLAKQLGVSQADIVRLAIKEAIASELNPLKVNAT